MNDLTQKLSKLIKDFESIKDSLNLKEKENELTKLEASATDPDFWKDHDKARSVMQEIGHIKEKLSALKKIEDDLSTLQKFREENEALEGFKSEISKLEEEIKKLKIDSYLSGPYDKKNALLSIHAGQGGTEAMDWASMLHRMYLRFFEKRGWKTETIDYSEGEEAGIKSVTVSVDGLYAYGYLKGEAGTHRLVRQSPFNADKLRQTSFALVEVLPELEEVDFPDIKIKDDDLEWQFFRASSQGGQNVQKVSTAVRLKHLPTELVVTAQTERYQEANRKIALNLLRAKLWAREQAMKEREVKDIKGDYRPASWGNQIRSYVLHPYKMVKDLRTEIESSDPEAILDGDLDTFIEAELKFLGNNRSKNNGK